MTEVKKTATAEKTVKKATPAKKTATVKKTADKPKTAVAKPTVKKIQTEKITKSSNTVYATGKRKDSIARVYLTPGKGNIVVNNIPMNEYFKRAVLQMILGQPFGVTKREGSYDVQAIVSGGGLSGQAGAVKHGISKALEKSEPELRNALTAAGFLTRDSRVVERKHYGKRKARRSTQFSKR